MVYSPTEIGQTIKHRRESLRLTQEQLAARLGKSLSMVKQMESGVKVKSWPSVAETANVLSMTPNELLGYDRTGLPNADSLAAALEPLLSQRGVAPELCYDVARSLLEAIEAVQELQDGERVPQAYSAAARVVSRRAADPVR